MLVIIIGQLHASRPVLRGLPENQVLLRHHRFLLFLAFKGTSSAGYVLESTFLDAGHRRLSSWLSLHSCRYWTDLSALNIINYPYASIY